MNVTRLPYALPLLLSASVLLAVSVVPAAADSGFVSPREEIPLTSPLTTGARSLGMGGVGVAVADDATAVTMNPAGLARLRRIEVSGSFSRRSRDIDGEMSGSDFKSSSSHTDLSSVRAAYPFPTFRGSMVMGFAVDRVYDFTDDRLAAYVGPVTWTEPRPDRELTADWAQTEDYVSDGGIYAWSAAAGVDVSPNVALGAALSYYSGDYAYTFKWDLGDSSGVSDAYTEVHMLEQYDTNASGLRATIGSIFYLSDRISLGLAVDTPLTLTFSGAGRIRTEKVGEDSADDALFDDTSQFEEKVELPFSFRAGAAYLPVGFVLLGADVSYTDWSEMKYEGPLSDTAYDSGVLTREALYGETFDYAVGVEVIVPTWPLRLRAGYASRPLVYKGLDITTDRSCFTLGAGVLVDTVLVLDLAWMHSTSERSDSEYAFVEDTTDQAMILEATYRF